MDEYLLWMDVLLISNMGLSRIAKIDCMRVRLGLGHFYWMNLTYHLRTIGKSDMWSFHLVILGYFLQIAF